MPKQSIPGVARHGCWALALAVLPAAVAAQDAANGRALYETYCAVCHGPGGRGDGQMAPILTVLPPDLTGLAARNGGSFPVFPTARQIDGRDPLLAHGGDMPVFGDFFDALPMLALQEASGERVMVSAPVADLIAYLREIQE